MTFVVVGVLSDQLAQDPARAITTAIERLPYELEASGTGVVILPSVRSAKLESPENTSSSVIRGAVGALKHLGVDVAIGGNPPKALPGPQMVDLFEKAGITEIASRLRVPQLLDQRTEVVPLRSGRTAKFFAVAQYLTRGTRTVLVPRLRPDNLLMFGAVRGSTSAVPGFKRDEMRLSSDEVGRYAEQLVDLAEAIRPSLVVLETGLRDPAALVGDSPYAVDMAAAVLLGIDPWSVATISAAAARDLGPLASTDLETIILQ